MTRKLMALLCSALVLFGLLNGCAGPVNYNPETGNTAETSQEQTQPQENEEQQNTAEENEASDMQGCGLEDGEYAAYFNTDSSMFHVNEANEGKGVLSVSDGVMSIHISLPSQKILQLFRGSAEDAQKEGAELLLPTIDTVTYSDGTSEEVHGFDIPVPALDEEFDCALIGTKGTWYDHKVSVSLVPEEESAATEENDTETGAAASTIEVSLSGGSGRASIESPTAIEERDGVYYAIITWSSPNYEYMLIDEVRYDPIQSEGNSTFELPVVLDEDMPVSAMNVAMSSPHLIEYTLHFDSSTLKSE